MQHVPPHYEWEPCIFRGWVRCCESGSTHWCLLWNMWESSECKKRSFLTCLGFWARHWCRSVDRVHTWASCVSFVTLPLQPLHALSLHQFFRFGENEVFASVEVSVLVGPPRMSWRTPHVSCRRQRVFAEYQNHQGVNRICTCVESATSFIFINKQNYQYLCGYIYYAVFVFQGKKITAHAICGQRWYSLYCVIAACLLFMTLNCVFFCVYQSRIWM